MTHVKNKSKHQHTHTLPLINTNITPNHNQNLYHSTSPNQSFNFYNNNHNQNPSNRLSKIFIKHSNRIGEIEVDHSQEKIHQRRLEEDINVIQKKSYLRNKKHQNLSRSREQQKSIKQKRLAKSVMELHDEEPYLSPSFHIGKYKYEVMAKFNEYESQNMSDQRIVKSNEQIKQLIRKYNDILTEMINKSIRQFITKKKFKTPVEDCIKIVQQQIKNNQKIQNFDNTEFKKLSGFKTKLEQQQNYNVVDMEETIIHLHSQIRDIRKQIQVIQSVVEKQSKKFITNDHSAIKPEIHPQIAQIKEKLLKAKKEWLKNEQKIANLQKQEKSLQIKLSHIQPKEREAVQIIQNDRVNEYKNKKLEDAKKRLEVLKNHCLKVQNLFKAKSNLILYENENFKQRIKGFDEEMNNLEESVKISFQKTFNLLTQCTPKNQGTKKILDRILQEMICHQNTSAFNKVQNLQIMQELVAKRNSYDHILKLADKKKPILVKKYENVQKQTKNKTKSQQSQRNRVWKLDDIESKQNFPLQQNIRISLPNKNQSLLRSSENNDKNYFLQPKSETNGKILKAFQFQQAGADEQENEFIL